MADVNGGPSGDLPGRRAGLFSPLARGQYAALIWLQSRIFINGLRTMRGSFELGARILTGALFFAVAVGPAFGMGAAAYVGVTHGRRLAIVILLWVLCVVWQFFSAFAPALAGQNPDLTHLLRYPVSFGSWVLLFLMYGVVAPSTLIGLLWTAGITVGITLARPGLFVWTALTLGIFVLFNLLLARTILAWLERWMAQRRTREIVTGIFLFLGLGLQGFNPAFHHYHRGLPFGMGQKSAAVVSSRVWKIQEMFPPGLASAAISEPMRGGGLSGTLPLGGLGLYTVAIGGLLMMRLRSESRGENLGEAPRREAAPRVRVAKRSGGFRGFSGPISAVFEKDLRYLLRSGPMLYSLVAPLVMAFVFSGAFRGGHAASFRATYGLPLGMVWAFMGLTRLVNNSLGGEAQGIFVYFLSPTPLRSVMLGKNALHLAAFVAEAVVISVVVIIRFGWPAPSVAAATVAWILVSVPLNFAAGNALSIMMPYRMSMARMRNEPGALGNGLMSLLIQMGTVGIGALVLVPLSIFGHPWLATPVFLGLAVVSVVVYLRVLGRVDGMFRSRQEPLMADLAKTA